MLEVGETVPPLKPSTKMPNPVFLTLSDSYFPVTFDIALHHIYVIAALMFTYANKHTYCIAHTHRQRYTALHTHTQNSLKWLFFSTVVSTVVVLHSRTVKILRLRNYCTYTYRNLSRDLSRSL